jgi:uncharacterized protein (TIGR02145 family)
MKKVIISLLFPLSILSQTITDIDGNIYNTTIINHQEWMSSNLKTTRFQNGDTIQWMTNGSLANSTTPAYVHEFNDSLSIANWELNNGLLYNFYVAHDSRNVCPVGWLVPTESDFDTLRSYLEQDHPLESGITLKSIGGWLNNGSGTDVYGFNGYPTGYREDSLIYNLGFSVGYWSNTYDIDPSPNVPNNAFGMYLVSNYSEVGVGSWNPSNGNAIRCIKDGDFVGINYNNNIEINVYPNPTSNFINIDTKDLIFAKLYDLNGILLGVYNSLQINLQDFKKGIYILKLVTPNITKEVKIFKE